MIITHASILGALLVAPSYQPIDPPGLDGDGKPQLVSRTLDLSSLRMATPRGAYTDRWMPMLPLVRGIGGAFERPSLHGERWDSEDDLADRVVDHFLMNGEKEVETCELSRNGFLYVEAAASVIQEFEALVKDLEAQVLARPRLDIRRFTVTSDSMAAPLGGGLVPQATLEAWLAGGGKAANVIDETRRSVTLPEGRLHLTSDLQSHTITAGIETEIAQGVAAIYPEVREAAVGSELALSGFRLGNEVQLLYSVMQTQRQDRKGLEAAGQWTMTGDDGRVHRDDSLGWDESFGVTGGTVAGEARLTLGSYLVVAVGADEGKVSYVAIGLDPGSVASAPMASRRGGQETSWFVAPKGLIEPMELECEWLSADGERHEALNRTLESATEHALAGEMGGLGVHFSQDYRSMFGRLLETVEVHDEVDIGGKVLIVYASGDQGAVTRFAAAEVASRRSLLHVNVGTRDHSGSQAYRGALTVLDGGEGGIASGSEVFLAKSIDTEVAQNSSAQIPSTCTHFEGLALSMELKRVAGSKLAYRLKGQLTTDHGIGEGSANHAAPGGLAATATSHLMIHESGVATADASGNWTIIVGDPSDAGARVELIVTSD